MGVCTEIEVVGRSSQSWERAAAAAVKAAVESFADRCLVRRRPTESAAAAPSFTAEVIKLEMSLNEGQIEHYKAVVKVSFLSTVDSALYLASG
jgi:flavin-binding protein dodecin